jgi:8-oxo-dGTP pyrophosphatase MutT (NUDIX family)
MTSNAIMFAACLALAWAGGQSWGKRSLERPALVEQFDRIVEAADEGKLDKIQWIVNSIRQGYEGAGVILYVGQGPNRRYILGIKQGTGEAEYPGGKVERRDVGPADTARRELFEETGLGLSISRFHTKCTITGGTTGCEAHVFLVNLTHAEATSLLIAAYPDNAPGDTFTSFIRVKDLFAEDGTVLETVVNDVTGQTYPLRKFNRKYVLPQIKDFLLSHPYE